MGSALGDNGFGQVQRIDCQIQAETDRSCVCYIELIVPDHEAADLIRVITKLASLRGCTVHIWITPVEILTRVRTGERGIDAL